MFSSAEIGWPHAGHCERGTTRLYGGVSGTASPASSAHWLRQPRSSIFGRRWMTTFRKLPIKRPTRAPTEAAVSGPIAIAGMAGSLTASDDRAELEDRKVHRHHEAPDHHAEEDDDNGLEQARQRRHRVVDFALEKVRDLGEHAVERPGFLTDLRHLQKHRGGESGVVLRVGEARG